MTVGMVMALLLVGFGIGAVLVVAVKLVNHLERRQETKRRMSVLPHDIGDPSCRFYDHGVLSGGTGHCFWCCPDCPGDRR